MALELLERLAVHHPVVEVAHQDAGQLRGTLAEMIDKHLRLPRAIDPGKIEVHTDDAYRLPAHDEVGKHGAARLQHGQEQRLAVDDLVILAHEDGVAVPADAVWTILDGHGTVRTFRLDHIARNRARPFAEAAVGLLKRDDVRIEFIEHREHAIGLADPIEPDGLAHVVAGDAYGHGREDRGVGRRFKG